MTAQILPPTPGALPDVDFTAAKPKAAAVPTPVGGTPAQETDLAAIRKAATNFEAVFASEMLSHMFSGIHADSAFGGGNGEDMFRSLLVDQYGRAIANSGTLGIADQVTAAMIALQEKATHEKMPQEKGPPGKATQELVPQELATQELTTQELAK